MNAFFREKLNGRRRVFYGVTKGRKLIFLSYLKCVGSIFSVASLFVWIRNCFVFHEDNWLSL